jgi:hypothetical protein
MLEISSTAAIDVATVVVVVCLLLLPPASRQKPRKNEPDYRTADDPNCGGHGAGKPSGSEHDESDSYYRRLCGRLEKIRANQIAAFFTVVLALGTIWLAARTDDLVTDGREAAAAQAKLISDGNRISHEAYSVVQRAFVYPNNPAWVGIFPGPDGVRRWLLSPEWTNFGNTPTRGLEIEGWCPTNATQLADPWAAAPGSLTSNHRNYFVLTPKASTIGVSCDVSIDNVIGAATGALHIYITTRATYFDEFSDDIHISEYCVEVANISGDITGGKGVTSELHSRLGDVTIPCKNGRHNCTDKECDK